MNTTDLPELGPEARKRIERTLQDAQARLRRAVLEQARKAKLKPAAIKMRLKSWKTLLKYIPIDLRNSAAVQYFDSMAWEYLTSRSAPEFEALLGELSKKASKAFDGDALVVNDRNQYWVDEARDRAANSIVGERIPLRIDSTQVPALRELRREFNEMERSGPELYASFAEGRERQIVTDGPYDPQSNRIDLFIRLARQAMATLGFKFTDPSRAVYYWLGLLRQEAPHRYKRWRISVLCAASTELCMELETRAREAGTFTEKRDFTGKVQPVNASSTPHPVVKKKLGRPPLPGRLAAAKLKAEGGTNKQAAAVMYGNPYPSAQQVKNVPSILRNLRKSEQSDSPAKSKPPDPSKNGG